MAATEEELASAEGVGPTIAEAVIAWFEVAASGTISSSARKPTVTKGRSNTSTSIAPRSNQCSSQTKIAKCRQA